MTIDGLEGRVTGFCPSGQQIEATVVADQSAYLFTLFDNRQVPDEAEARALFDRFAATITLDPARAAASPSPNPSSS